MADTVTTKILRDGPIATIVLLTNVSDGTGESAVKKVTVGDLVGTPTRVRIDKIIYATNGMGVRLLWDGPTDVLAWSIPENSSDMLDFTAFGGLQNAATDPTGDIMLTTFGHTSGDSYSIILYLRKEF